MLSENLSLQLVEGVRGSKRVSVKLELFFENNQTRSFGYISFFCRAMSDDY